MGGAFQEKAPFLYKENIIQKKRGIVMLDFRMNTFLTVCRYMNFTRASEELHITQPAVSQHIRYLEKYYGEKLFCHEGRRLELTEAGELLRNASMTMLQDEKSLKSRMQNQESVRRNLLFGVAASLGDGWGTGVLKEYLKKDEKWDRQDRIHLKMESGERPELLEQLDRGEIEFALTEDRYPGRKYECCLFEEERLVPVCIPAYSFLKKPQKLQDLFGERILIGRKGTGTRTRLEEFLVSVDAEVEDFTKVVEIGDLHMMKELTKAGCGITFLYETVVREELENGQLMEIKLKDFQVSQKFMFVWKKGNQTAGQYRRFFEQYRKNGTCA